MTNIKKIITISILCVGSFASGACTTNLDVTGKSVINIGETIDGTSAISYEDAPIYFPMEGTSFYTKKYLSPSSTSTMKLLYAFKYCYSLKNSDIIKSDDGLYYIMDPDISSSTIYSREQPGGEGWKLITTMETRHLSNQAYRTSDVLYVTPVSEFGKYNLKGLYASRSNDNNEYWSSDPSASYTRSIYETYGALQFNQWTTSYNRSYNGSDSHGVTSTGYHTTSKLSVRCAR